MNKTYSKATILMIKGLISHRLELAGDVKTSEIIRLVKNQDKNITLIDSSISNIFKIIMDDLVEDGIAQYKCPGRWEILKAVRIAAPVPNRGDYSFLDKKGADPAEEVRQELKRLKKENKNINFNRELLRLCDEFNISIRYFNNYINQLKDANPAAVQG